MASLASNLKTVWTAPTTDARLKKRIVRTLIHEVVADIDDAASEIVLIVHWVGGAHSELRLPKRRRGQRNSTSADIIQAVRQLVLIASDDLIAGLLNRNGLKTGNGNRWTRERVTSMRSNYHIPVFKPAEDGIEPWLNLGNAAQILKIAPKTLRLAAEAGEIESLPSAIGWSLDLRPRRSHNVRCSIHHRTGAAKPKIPRRIASQSAKPLLINHIARWVFRCRVVEAFDVGEDITSGFLPCCILPVMDELGLERVEEALHRGIVVAVGLAAHRGPEAGGLHRIAILRRGILNAPIGMVDQAGARPLHRDGHAQGCQAAGRRANDPPSPSPRSCGCKDP